MSTHTPGKQYTDRMQSLLSLLDETEQEILSDPLTIAKSAASSGNTPLRGGLSQNASQKCKLPNITDVSLGEAETLRSSDPTSETTHTTTRHGIPEFANRGVLLNANHALPERQSPLSLPLGPSPDSTSTSHHHTPSPQGLPATSTSTQAHSVFSSIKEKMREQRQQLEQRGVEVERLRNELRAAEQRMAQQAEQAKRDLEERLSAQKQSYESVAARQMAFLESVLKEKEDLTTAAARLSRQIDELSAQFRSREEALQGQFKDEVRRLREQWTAAEKAKRERWVAEQSARIKEMTVKGLEPELQRILEKSKAEIAAERERCAQMLEQQRTDLLAEFSQEREGLLRQAAMGAEHAGESEREQGARRLREALDLSEQRAAALRAQHEAELQATRTALEAKIAALEAQLGANAARVREQVEGAVRECQQRHEARLRQLAEQDAIEKEQWQQLVLKRMQNDFWERENALRAELVRERDAELGMVAERLQEEREGLQRRVAQEYEDRLRTAVELRRKDAEKHQGTLARVEEEAEAARAQVSELRARVDALNAAREEAERAREEAVKDAKAQAAAAHGWEQRAQRLEEEAAGAGERVRGEWEEARRRAVAVAVEECENKWRSELQVQVLEARQSILRASEEEKTREMNELHARVSTMLERKDVVLNKYKSRVEELEAEVRALHMEMEKQKQELLAQLHDG